MPRHHVAHRGPDPTVIYIDIWPRFTSRISMSQVKKSALIRKPLKDEVFGILHQSILSGQYQAGAWLRQQEISRRLGVSMTPVREALDLLVSSGLAQRVAYRGVRVLQPTAPDILDAYEARLMLEGAASHLAAACPAPSVLAELGALLEEEERLLTVEDLPRQREMSRSLHGAIAQAGGNALLHRLYLQVLKSFPDWMLYEHLYKGPEMLEETLRTEHQEHVAIVEALASRRPDLALERALEHVMNRGRELERYLGIAHDALALRETHVRELIRTGNSESHVREKESL